MSRWQQAQPQGRLRKPCEGHSLSVVDRCVYVLFGKHEDDHGNPVCPPMQVLDTETMLLSTPTLATVDGMRDVPDDREGHTASVVSRRIYIFGGTWTDEEDATVYLNDLHVLDVVDTPKWSRPTVGGTPPREREGHTAAVIGSRMYIFGGTFVDEEVSVPCAASSASAASSVSVASSASMRPCPSPESWRALPSATLWWRPSLRPHSMDVARRMPRMIEGAELYMSLAPRTTHHAQDNSIYLNDLHVFETESTVWNPCTTSGEPPIQREGHTASIVGTSACPPTHTARAELLRAPPLPPPLPLLRGSGAPPAPTRATAHRCLPPAAHPPTPDSACGPTLLVQ